MKFTNKLERHQNDQRHNILWVGMITKPTTKPAERKPKQLSTRDEQRLLKGDWK